MAFIPDIELDSPEQQADFQLKKLKELVAYVSLHSPFYQQRNLDANTWTSLKDLEHITTTSKEDIQLYNDDFLCVPKSSIVEYTATSGTLGNPVTIALTQLDLDRLAYNEYLSFELMELNKDDVVQFMLTLDRQFMAGIAYYLGLQKTGAACVRTGPGLPSMQLDTIQRLGTTTLVAVPSFLIKLIEYAQKERIDLSALPIKKVLCIGENIRTETFELNALGKYIQAHWHVKLYSTYASTEMQTGFTECWHGRGGHAHPELIIVEIIDEEGKQLDAGEYGEVCITTLGVEGMPLLRYRTGDICSYEDTHCACGRTTRRLSPVMGRKKKMIKYKGTTLYPPAIFELLNQCSFIAEYVIEVKSNEMGMDDIVLHVSTPLVVDDCERKIKPFLQSQLRVVPLINYLSSAEIQTMQFPEGSRKAIKFIDHRKKGMVDE
jgi:phenylacetate-CoA ligase